MPSDVSMPVYKIPRSVLVVIHTLDLQVLMMERARQPGLWQSVTGSLDHPDETPREAAIREVFEETGIDARAHHLSDWQIENRYEIFLRWRARYGPGVTMNTEHVFGLALAQCVPVRLAPAEHLAHQWMPWDAAAEKCFSWSNRDAIRLLPARHGARPARRDGHWM